MGIGDCVSFTVSVVCVLGVCSCGNITDRRLLPDDLSPEIS